MQRVSLTPKTIELLSAPNFGYLATLLPDGSPHVTPVWVDYDAEKNLILVNTSIGRVKQKNVSRDPRVALAVTDASNAYRYVMIRGRVVEQVTKGAGEHINRLAKKYLGKDRYPLSAGEKRVVLKILPEEVSGQ